MKKNVKFLLAVSWALMPGWLYADCKSESAQLIQSLEEQVFGELSADQKQRATEVAINQCEQIDKNTDNPGSGDFFTDYLLSGEQADKPGNKRLKRK